MKTVSSDVYKITGNLLRVIIKENGVDIFKDTDALEAKLKEKNCNATVLYQILLLVKSGNVTRYIPQIATGISMVDVNNIIACAEVETGLGRKTVKEIVTCMLYGLSLPTAIETVAIPADAGYQFKDTAIVDFADYEEDLKVIDWAVTEKNVEKLVEYAPKLELMATAGHPEALYLKGACYYQGIGAEQNEELALKFLNAAAHGGSLRANAMLGDYYAESTYPSNTTAFGYYTAIGASALDEKRQRNIKAILQQKDTNMMTLGLSFAMLVVIIVFSILLGMGTFSFNGHSHWVCAVFSIVLNLGVFAGGVFFFTKLKYDSIKWMIPCMIVIAMFFAMIAL